MNPLAKRVLFFAQNHNLSFGIRLLGLFLRAAPKRILLNRLDVHQRAALNEVLELGQGKACFVELMGAKTPPIMLDVALPVRIKTMPRAKVDAMKLPGIVLDIKSVLELKPGADPLELLLADKIVPVRMGRLLRIMAPFLNVPYESWAGPNQKEA